MLWFRDPSSFNLVARPHPWDLVVFFIHPSEREVENGESTPLSSLKVTHVFCLHSIGWDHGDIYMRRGRERKSMSEQPLSGNSCTYWKESLDFFVSTTGMLLLSLHSLLVSEKKSSNSYPCFYIGKGFLFLWLLSRFSVCFWSYAVWIRYS